MRYSNSKASDPFYGVVFVMFVFTVAVVWIVVGTVRALCKQLWD